MARKQVLRARSERQKLKDEVKELVNLLMAKAAPTKQSSRQGKLRTWRNRKEKNI